MELSEEDLALINALQIAPRISWADAAGVLGVHATTLAARWDRLQAAGAAWITAHLIGDPKQMCLAFVDVDCEMSLRDDVTAALAAIPEMVTVEEAASNRDLMLTVITPTLEEFSGPRGAAVQGNPGPAEVPDVAVHPAALRRRCLAAQRSGQGAAGGPAGAGAGPRPPARPRPRPGCAAAAEPPGPDAVPGPGRAGHRGGHRPRLGRSPATVQRQLNRVLASGLLSFRCEMAQKYSGYPVTCQWFANVPPGQHEAAAAELRGLRNVRLSASTTGRTNFVIIMWLHSLADVMNAELALQQRIPEIELVESAVMLSTAKRVGWMLNPDSTASGAVVVPAAELAPTA